MSTLKVTTLDGVEHEFPFTAGSQLTVVTPDGANGTRHGSWGEVVQIRLDGDAPENGDQPGRRRKTSTDGK